MAIVVFRDEINKIEVNKRMFPPKKVEHLDHWFRQACKTISQIPATHTQINTQCNARWITWELTSPKGERSYVVIDRRAPAIG